MFTATQNKGFSMTFENGLTVSVQWGTGNYCEKRSFSAPYNGEMENQIWSSENAEIAIWDRNNAWYDFGSDQVKGWVTTDEVAEWIYKVSHWKDINGY